MKKFLISAAAIAALATSAVAYDNFYNMEIDPAVNSVSTAPRIVRTNTQFGNALLFPYYAVVNGYTSTIKVINTLDRPVVAKVVFFEKTNSNEVRDFNIYLSPKDEWIGVVSQGDDGKIYVTSTDDSAVANAATGEFATENNPMNVEFKDSTATSGYVEVIGLAVVNGLANPHDKPSIRSRYLSQAETARNITSTKLLFNDGTLTTDVLAPNIDLTTTASLSEVPNDALTGTIELQNTQFKTNLVTSAIGLDIYSDAANTGLLYIEGEKATVADAEIGALTTDKDSDGNNDAGYNVPFIATDILNITNNIKEVYVPYKAADLPATAVLATIPMKKYAVNQLIANNILQPTGELKLITQIFDAKENMFKDAQFSPYSTPYLTASNEVNYLADITKNVNYANEKTGNAFEEGFIVIRNFNINSATGNNEPIPAIFTEMKATSFNGSYATNWFIPAAK
jgi:hypothetical protein